MHHRRVVVRRHAAVGQAAHRGLGRGAATARRSASRRACRRCGSTAPARSPWRRPAGCRHSCGCARSPASASCGPMSLSTRRRMRPRSGAGRGAQADGAAHRGAEPVAAASMPSWSSSATREPRVEGQAVLALRLAGSIGSGRGRWCRGRSRASAAPGARRCRPCRARCAPGRARRSPSRRGRRPTRCSGSRGPRS